MESTSQIRHAIEEAAIALGFIPEWREDFNQLNIWAESRWFSVNVSFHDSEIFSYINVRGRWGVGGNKTPSIDFLSFYIGFFLYLAGYGSVCIWDVEHPFVEGELSAQYLSLEQVQRQPTPLMNAEGVKGLLVQLLAIHECIASFLKCSYSCCATDGMQINSVEFDQWVKYVLHAIPNEYIETTYCDHSLCPPIWYCFVEKAGISILYAPDIIEQFTEILTKIDSVKIGGLSGDLYLFKGIRHCIPYDVQIELSLILNNLVPENKDLTFGAFENVVFAVAGSYLIKKTYFAGVKAFSAEREAIRVRHQLESYHLFGCRRYNWKDDIDDDRFELLCEALLKHEDNVRWARKVGVGRAADGGKDIVFERQIPNLDDHSEYFDIRCEKWIAQCKAYKGNVGKGAVSDIRDIVEDNNSTGYLLIVLHSITPALLDHLSRLNERGKIRTDWWTRTELEERLDKNPYLVDKFNDLVSFEN